MQWTRKNNNTWQAKTCLGVATIKKTSKNIYRFTLGSDYAHYDNTLEGAKQWIKRKVDSHKRFIDHWRKS